MKIVLLLSIFLFLMGAVNAQIKNREKDVFESVLIDLKKIPDEAEKKALEKEGVFLQGYYSGTTYFALKKKGVSDMTLLSQSSGSDETFTVDSIQLSVKLDDFLLKKNIPEDALVKGKKDVVRVTVAYFPDFDVELIGKYISANRLQNLEKLAVFNMFNIDLPFSLIEDLAMQSWVRRIECIPPPNELFNVQGRTMSRASVLAYNGIGGRNLTGKGVRVGIWDGNIEAHPDLGNRAITRQFFKPSANGQHVSGTMIGAGLLDPRARGMAPEAVAYTWNFNKGSVPMEMIECAQKDKIVVTQNSYGLPNKRYCDLPRKYDLQEEQIDLVANYYPEMLHVYAAGNDQQVCGGVSRYLTSAKRAKNVIMVGALDETTKMSDFSSWGPTNDGRLLPHISAFGVGVYSTVYNNKYEVAKEGWSGTSMACPVVSGLSTLLYERYRQLNNNKNPKAILIKGALLNTAQDRGNVGPDYQFGYGRADGEEAVKVLENKQYEYGKNKEW